MKRPVFEIIVSIIMVLAAGLLGYWYGQYYCLKTIPACEEGDYRFQ